ncbi:MAG: 5-(carboxyamino)imidazole ribonucleotide mutase [Micrococcus sp.]|nr:5-(carboxyamino)imidazole ribonucleotide mutase [Micrococcus sp.]
MTEQSPTHALTTSLDGRPAQVAVVMGSDSDWPVMSAAVEALRALDVPVEVGVVSAHRMAREMVEFGSTAHERGLRVIIAGAGGAAHLPGMLASLTPLPVIGVPVKLKSLDGLDSLLSIVQMPGGVPVATVSIDGAKNAGLLAARMLGAGESAGAAALRERLVQYSAELNAEATAKGVRLQQQCAVDGEAGPA